MSQTVVLILLVVMAVWLLRYLFPAQRKPKLAQAYKESAGARKGPYQAVSIHDYSNACSAAEALHGQRFLAGETPLLPLESCQSDVCHCVYVHHVDRRSGNSGRRSLRGIEEGYQLMFGKQERRQSCGRRHNDLVQT